MKLITSLVFLKYLFLLVAISLITLGIHDYCNERDYQKRYQDSFKEIIKSGDSNKNVERYKDVFQLKHTYYENHLEKFSGIQTWMLAILCSSILVLIFGVDNISLFNLNIPDGLLYMVIFFGGIYFWVNFGLTFNSLIDERLSLMSYLDKIEKYNWGEIEYVNSPKHILLDNSLMDNWFIHYFEIFKDGKSESVFFEILGLYGIYALNLGVYIGTIIISIIEFAKRKLLNVYFSGVLLLFAIAIFLASTYTFLIGDKQYSIMWMGAIWSFAAISLFFWDLSGDKMFKKYSKKNKLI
ncbi:hypothetical protein ACFQ1R_10235 [Mariniflexile jejuense]|uniref:Uncharacterized protein n=1 Tax=Mariniflexile jejuense TaxID=1173582 RepID=A0ABW3JK28_9FLAO